MLDNSVVTDLTVEVLPIVRERKATFSKEETYYKINEPKSTDFSLKLLKIHLNSTTIYHPIKVLRGTGIEELQKSMKVLFNSFANPENLFTYGYRLRTHGFELLNMATLLEVSDKEAKGIYLVVNKVTGETELTKTDIRQVRVRTVQAVPALELPGTLIPNDLMTSAIVRGAGKYRWLATSESLVSSNKRSLSAKFTKNPSKVKAIPLNCRAVDVVENVVIDNLPLCEESDYSHHEGQVYYKPTIREVRISEDNLIKTKTKTRLEVMNLTVDLPKGRHYIIKDSTIYIAVSKSGLELEFWDRNNQKPINRMADHLVKIGFVEVMK